MKAPMSLAVASLVFALHSVIIFTGHANATQAQVVRPYQVKVIDATTRRPVAKAKVTIELQNASKTKWEGRTDPDGVFTFRCDLPNGSVRARTAIEATGYWTMDGWFPLIEERVIELKKAD